MQVPKVTKTLGTSVIYNLILKFSSPIDSVVLELYSVLPLGLILWPGEGHQADNQHSHTVDQLHTGLKFINWTIASFSYFRLG